MDVTAIVFSSEAKPAWAYDCHEEFGGYIVEIDLLRVDVVEFCLERADVRFFAEDHLVSAGVGDEEDVKENAERYGASDERLMP